MLVPVLTVAENILLGDETMANRDLPRSERGPPSDRRARSALRIRDRPRREGRLALGRLAAAGRDPQGPLPGGADPRPRRADGSADAAGDERDLRRPPAPARRGPQHHLHQPQAVRGPRDRGPDHGHPPRPGRRRADAVRDGRGRPRRADGRPRGPADRGPRREPPGRSCPQGGRPQVQHDRGREVVRGVASRSGPARSSASPAWPATARTSWSRRHGAARPSAGRIVARRPGRHGRVARGSCTSLGVSFVPADRHRFGLVLSFPLTDNLVLTDYYAAPYARGPSAKRRRDPDAGRRGDRAVRRPHALARRDRRDPVGRQPAEGRRGARIRPRPAAARARPADTRPRRRQRRIHPSPDDREARCGHRRAPRVGGARRGARAVRSDRRHVSGPARGRPRRARPPTRSRSACSWRPEARGTGASSHRIADAACPRDRAGSLPAARPVGAIVLALLVGAVVIIVTSPLITGQFDVSLPITTYGALSRGRSCRSTGSSIRSSAATPLILVGLAVGLCFKAGLFNIGGQGQFLIGAVTAAAGGAPPRRAPPIIAIPAGDRRRGAAGRLRLHPRLPQGVHRRTRSRHHDHAQLHRDPDRVLRRPAHSGPRRLDRPHPGRRECRPADHHQPGHRSRRPPRHPLPVHRGRGHLLAALPNHARLRDPDRGCESRCRPVRGHATAATDHPHDESPASSRASPAPRTSSAWPAT